MNLQIRFVSDDTTEERDAASPCIYDIFEPVLKHPSEERWYLWFPDADHPFSFCGRSIWTLNAHRGSVRVWVWRIKGQDDVTKALIGEWQSAYVETRAEQIERLTTERDAAKKSDAETMEILTRAHATACKFAADVSAEKARADAAVKRLADLRAWAAGEVATWGVSCGCMGKVMLRIDRKDGEGQ
jgi:hypothetical protein